MNKNFVCLLEPLEPKFQNLLASRPVRTKSELPTKHTPGVYLFSELETPLYVGRSNDIKGRYGRHCDPGATHRMAAFAFRLAREETGYLKASYKPGAFSRAGLMENEQFVSAYSKAKNRIREMEFRWIHESDSTQQCLLEIYCAVSRQTPYNDFDNH